MLNEAYFFGIYQVCTCYIYRVVAASISMKNCFQDNKAKLFDKNKKLGTKISRSRSVYISVLFFILFSLFSSSRTLC